MFNRFERAAFLHFNRTSEDEDVLENDQNGDKNSQDNDPDRDKDDYLREFLDKNRDGDEDLTSQNFVEGKDVDGKYRPKCFGPISITDRRSNYPCL